MRDCEKKDHSRSYSSLIFNSPPVLTDNYFEQVKITGNGPHSVQWPVNGEHELSGPASCELSCELRLCSHTWSSPLAPFLSGILRPLHTGTFSSNSRPYLFHYWVLTFTRGRVEKSFLRFAHFYCKLSANTTTCLMTPFL